MKNRKKYLYEGIKMLWRIHVAFFLATIVLFFLGLALHLWNSPVWVVFFLLFLMIEALFVVVVPIIHVGRIEKNIEQYDQSFIVREEREQEYYPQYYWTFSNREVINRYINLNNRRVSVEKSVEASRYMALQQQINPHFLYNTLDSIRSDLLLGEDSDTLADTIEALARYFSYVVSNLDYLANVSDELNNVRDYFSIQKFRFGDRISLETDIELSESDLLGLYLPRMTIQPLVENAITHGLELLGNQGTVIIRMRRSSENLHIEVSDDGVGMSPESLLDLNRQMENSGSYSPLKKDRGGIALKNVNSRIKLLFGEGYGLTAESIENVGTTIKIMLPIHNRKEVR